MKIFFYLLIKYSYFYKYFKKIVGYENKDWYIPSPALNEDEIDTASLSKEYIRETLNYFRE